jgi:hypothetical protein
MTAAILQDAIRQIEAEAAHDPVERPLHYTEGAVQCLDAIECAIAGLEGIEAHLTACSIRYLWRWKRKNGIQDLLKAQNYLARLIRTVEAEPSE